ncbi:hypothetical protein [Proteiniborus sp. DW1]|nr:hypothetical protein [Proteiniborus sp. DW1]
MDRYKDISIVSHINDEIENQRSRYQDNNYHPYDHISKIKLKEKTNNIR